MSDFDSFIQIRNDLPFELNGGTFNITKGSFIGVPPEAIPSGTATEIHVAAANPDDGSAGEFTYTVVIGGAIRKVIINFACNNALKNFVISGSPFPVVSISPYSAVDHPLKATAAVSMGGQQ